VAFELLDGCGHGRFDVPSLDLGVVLADGVAATVVPVNAVSVPLVAAVAAPPDSIKPPMNPPVATAPASASETIPLRSPFIDPNLPDASGSILHPQPGRAL